MTTLPQQIVALHDALSEAGLPHAFGGALALAWCTERARGTIGIDVNVFVDVDQAATVLRAMPSGARWSRKDVAELRRDGQVRLWWNRTPVDLFLNSTSIHGPLAERTRWEDFTSRRLPFLCCNDLAVFKAFFDRTKDWADLEAMRDAGTLNIAYVIGVLAEHLGADHARIERLQGLSKPVARD